MNDMSYQRSALRQINDHFGRLYHDVSFVNKQNRRGERILLPCHFESPRASDAVHEMAPEASGSGTGSRSKGSALTPIESKLMKAGLAAKNQVRLGIPLRRRDCRAWRLLKLAST